MKLLELQHMDKTKLAKIVSISALLLAGTQAQAATWLGSQSNAIPGFNYIEVGESTVNGGPHASDRAGIGVSSFPGLGTSGKVDFQGLTASSTLADGVYTLSSPITGAPGTHNNLGVFSFAKAGSGDVWFGEWSENGNTPDVNNDTYNGRQVYYSGLNSDDDLNSGLAATSSVVLYNVKGINHQAVNGTLSGNFVAAFNGSGGTLVGGLANATNDFVLNIGTAKINTDASIETGNISASVYTNSTLTGGGDVEGNFFNGQTALAGIVTFSNPDLNTAFGGSWAVAIPKP